MSLQFSVEDGQSVTLSDGTCISFRVNPADTSEVAMHVVQPDADPAGTHIFTFKRNGSLSGTTFVERPEPGTDPAYLAMREKEDARVAEEAANAPTPSAAPAKPLASGPLSGFKSVDDEPLHPGTSLSGRPDPGPPAPVAKP